MTPTRAQRKALLSDHPLFFAHRGGSLLAPENTFVAFDRGAALGADALELDIHATRDGALVVIHDPTLDRTTDGTGPVAARTLDELRRLDAGYRFTSDGGATYPYRGQGITIPTLRAVYERYPTHRVNIDIKGGAVGQEALLWGLIQEVGAQDRTIIGSSDGPAALAAFRRVSAGRVATSASAVEVRNFLFAYWSRAVRLLRPAYDALQVPEVHRGIRVVSRGSVAAAHRLGLPVHVWTVDDRADMERLLDWGVDGLMSDRPDTLAEVLAARA